MFLLALVPALQSCDDDGFSIGDIGWVWATVRATGGGGYYLEGDRWGMIAPVASSIPWYKPVDGERVVAFFNPLADTDKGAQVKIEGIQEVLTKEVEDMTAENEEEFGNDPIVIYQGDMWLGGKFLNIIFHQYLPRSEKHRISLVQNKIDPEAPALIVSPCIYRLNAAEHNPVSRYEPNIRRPPISSSNRSPTYMKAYMFIRRWKAPICMKLQVTVRHQSPGRVSGPKSAPHFSSDRVEGDIIPTPEAIITMNTRNHHSVHLMSVVMV